MLDTGVHRVRCENATIVEIEGFAFEELPFYHIKVISCNVKINLKLFNKLHYVCKMKLLTKQDR